MQENNDEPNIVEFQDAFGENEDSTDMQQGGDDDGELDRALQEGPTEDQLSTQGKTTKVK